MKPVGDNFPNWTYTSYEKIPASLTQWQITESEYRPFKKTDWVVTEKIHGANFGIIIDGISLRFAKGQDFLQPGEDFFDYQSLQETLVPPQIQQMMMTKLHQEPERLVEAHR